MLSRLRSFYWRHGLYSWKDNTAHWIARNLIPKRLIYWCVIVASVRVTADNESPDQVSAMDILKRMDAN